MLRWKMYKIDNILLQLLGTVFHNDLHGRRIHIPFFTCDMLTGLFWWCKASTADGTESDLWLLERQGILLFGTALQVKLEYSITDVHI